MGRVGGSGCGSAVVWQIPSARVKAEAEAGDARRRPRLNQPVVDAREVWRARPRSPAVGAGKIRHPGLPRRNAGRATTAGAPRERQGKSQPRRRRALTQGSAPGLTHGRRGGAGAREESDGGGREGRGGERGRAHLAAAVSQKQVCPAAFADDPRRCVGDPRHDAPREGGARERSPEGYLRWFGPRRWSKRPAGATLEARQLRLAQRGERRELARSRGRRGPASTRTLEDVLPATYGSDAAHVEATPNVPGLSDAIASPVAAVMDAVRPLPLRSVRKSATVVPMVASYP